VHFDSAAEPAAIGYKALAVNLSDLAAMGAEPAWAMLALTLPHADEDWLEAFSTGFCALAREHGVALVGGDTTRGPLAVTVQVHGFVAAGAALRRAGARPGKLIQVNGTLGDAGLALLLGRDAAETEASGHRAWLRSRLDRPMPRIAQGLQLPGRAHAAIDVSDGLLADLGHILEASGVGATLWLGRMPLSDAFRKCIDNLGRDRIENLARRLHCDDPADVAVALALTAGDDYELCFTTAPAAAVDTIAGLRCTGIGVIESAPGLRCLRPDGTSWRPGAAGYDHFSGEQADGDVRA
jgi:thiamine-monophosphate kinase